MKQKHSLVLLMLISCFTQTLLANTGGLPDTSSGLNNAVPGYDNDGEPKKADGLYEAGNFKEAAQRFLSEGGPNALYNSARSWHEDFIVNGEPVSLDRAVDGYYRVLDLEPDSPEALRNLELARREQERLWKEREENKENRSDNSQSQSEQQRDNLKELADRQQQLADESEAGKSRDNEREGESQQSAESQLSQQNELKKETESAMEQSESKDIRESLNEALEEQKKAISAMEKGEDGSDAQSRAAEALKKAVEASEMDRDTEQSEKNGRSESNRAADTQDLNPDGLPDELQSMLNAEQDRRRNEQESDDRMIVEKNW